MIDALFLGIGALTLAAGIIRAVSLRRHATPALRALCLILITLGLAFVLLSDSVQAVESRLYPNLGRLLSNCATLTAAFGAQALLLNLSQPPEIARRRVRGRLVGALGAIVVLVGLFVASRTPAPTGTFGSLYATQPTLAFYALVYAGYLGVAVADLGWQSWRYSCHARRRYLRAGLRTITMGCALALVYVIDKVVSVVHAWLGGAQPGPSASGLCPSPLSSVGCATSVALPAVAVLVIVVGVTLPAWGPRLELPVRWIAQWRSYHRLRPLWAVLHDVFPEIALTSPSGVSGSYSRHDAGMRLYRRVIEIRDGALLLRDYRDPTVAAAAEAAGRRGGLRDERLRATVEAAELAAAIEARRRNRRAASPVTHLPAAAVLEPDLRSESAWLVQVSDAFRRSPVVAEQARRADEPISGGRRDR